MTHCCNFIGKLNATVSLLTHLYPLLENQITVWSSLHSRKFYLIATFIEVFSSLCFIICFISDVLAYFLSLYLRNAITNFLCQAMHSQKCMMFNTIRTNYSIQKLFNQLTKFLKRIFLYFDFYFTWLTRFLFPIYLQCGFYSELKAFKLKTRCIKLVSK